MRQRVRRRLHDGEACAQHDERGKTVQLYALKNIVSRLSETLRANAQHNEHHKAVNLHGGGLKILSAGCCRHCHARSPCTSVTATCMLRISTCTLGLLIACFAKLQNRSVVKCTSWRMGETVTWEAAMVRTDQAAMPAANRRGRSARSASSPTGTSAAAYSTCCMSWTQIAQPGGNCTDVARTQYRHHACVVGSSVKARSAQEAGILITCHDRRSHSLIQDAVELQRRCTV